MLLAIATVPALAQCDRAPQKPASGDESVAPGVGAEPAFRFSSTTKELVPTEPGTVRPRTRRAGERAAAAARDALARLYAEAFLDPANWSEGVYDDAFVDFAVQARDEAARRTALLTAGAGAGDRYDEIRPINGRLATRILLDRTGTPTLLVSTVRFSAAALGPEPQTLRSVGEFFFERIDGAWRIVSFHVVRTDEPREAA